MAETNNQIKKHTEERQMFKFIVGVQIFIALVSVASVVMLIIYFPQILEALLHIIKTAWAKA